MKTGYQKTRLMALLILLAFAVAPVMAQVDDEGDPILPAAECYFDVGPNDEWVRVDPDPLTYFDPADDGYIRYYRHKDASPTDKFQTWRYCFKAPGHVSSQAMAKFEPSDDAQPLGIEGTLCSRMDLELELDLSCLGQGNIVEGGTWEGATILHPGNGDFKVRTEGGKVIMKWDDYLLDGQTRYVYFTMDVSLSESMIGAIATDTYPGYDDVSTMDVIGPAENGEIFGAIWRDDNGDGVGDVKVDGVVSLFDGMVKDDEGPTVDPLKFYIFEGKNTSTAYDVDVIESSLSPQLSPVDPSDAGPVTITWMPVGDPVCARQDFVFEPTDPALGALGDYVWYDYFKDGLQGATENGVYDVLVTILAGPSNVGATQRTDKNGEYHFYDLVPGSYTVQADGTTAWRANIVGPQPGGPTSGQHALKRGDSEMAIKGDFDQDYPLPPITDVVIADNINLGFDFFLTFGGLPVELASFTGQVVDNAIVLSWETASESNNSGFAIEQAVSGMDYEEIGFVDGAGNSTELRTYGYRMGNVTPAQYRFRLRMIDFDGNSSYSEEIEVDASLPDKYFVGTAYPNPFNPQTTIAMSVAEAQNVRVVIHDALGRAVLPLMDRPVEANQPYQVRIDGSMLPSGVYIVRFEGESFTTARQILLTK